MAFINRHISAFATRKIEIMNKHEYFDVFNFSKFCRLGEKTKVDSQKGRDRAMWTAVSDDRTKGLTDEFLNDLMF